MPAVVPPLSPCPVCGVHLPDGDGPNDLVWHGCVKPELTASSKSPLAQVEGVVSNPNATPLELATAIGRFLLAEALDGNDKHNQIALAMTINNLARVFKEAGGAENSEEADLLTFIQGFKPESETG